MISRSNSNNKVITIRLPHTNGGREAISCIHNEEKENLLDSLNTTRRPSNKPGQRTNAPTKPKTRNSRAHKSPPNPAVLSVEGWRILLIKSSVNWFEGCLYPFCWNHFFRCLSKLWSSIIYRSSQFYFCPCKRNESTSCLRRSERILCNFLRPRNKRIFTLLSDCSVIEPISFTDFSSR